MNFKTGIQLGEIEYAKQERSASKWSIHQEEAMSERSGVKVAPSPALPRSFLTGEGDGCLLTCQPGALPSSYLTGEGAERAANILMGNHADALPPLRREERGRDGKGATFTIRGRFNSPRMMRLNSPSRRPSKSRSSHGPSFSGTSAVPASP
jgi:hypothetical protein